MEAPSVVAFKFKKRLDRYTDHQQLQLQILTADSSPSDSVYDST